MSEKFINLHNEFRFIYFLIQSQYKNPVISSLLRVMTYVKKRQVTSYHVINFRTIIYP